jgi:pyridoxamine 5'-phosphate oxidase
MVSEQRYPLELFDEWFKAAAEREPNEPNAMALASVGADGMPSLRMVLLKGVDDRGFVFYTNYEGRKGQQLLAHPQAALCFHWKASKRQVRIEGAVEQVTPEEADAYFATRARTSQIGAWASQQSRPLTGRRNSRSVSRSSPPSSGSAPCPARPIGRDSGCFRG